MNAANPKFAKYSNGPIEGINRKIKLLRRLNFGMPNFINMKKRIILRLNFKPKKKNSKKIADFLEFFENDAHKVLGRAGLFCVHFKQPL